MPVRRMNKRGRRSKDTIQRFSGRLKAAIAKVDGITLDSGDQDQAVTVFMPEITSGDFDDIRYLISNPVRAEIVELRQPEDDFRITNPVRAEITTLKTPTNIYLPEN